MTLKLITTGHRAYNRDFGQREECLAAIAEIEAEHEHFQENDHG